MSTLTIRNLPETVHAALRLMAARDGISVEAEVRQILAKACRSPTEPVSILQQTIDDLYGDHKPVNVVEDLLAERRMEAAKE